MKIDKVGSRYNYYYKFETEPIVYDYEHKGLLNRIMSSAILRSENKLLKFTLGSFESSLLFVLKYIDRLKGFKNYTKNNR